MNNVRKPVTYGEIQDLWSKYQTDPRPWAEICMAAGRDLRHIMRLFDAYGFDYKSIIHPRQCPFCRDIFYPSPARKYCSKRCSDAARLRRNLEKQMELAAPKNVEVKRDAAIARAAGTTYGKYYATHRRENGERTGSN